MSARPDVPRLSDEELDLLISRSLDGDLSPEEEEKLERLVALDPAAARRKADLAALVADVKALPEPAAPFALATRVSSNVSSRAGRPGSLGGRVGFFPAPGFAKAALVVLGIVAVSIAVLRPVPKHAVEGPVDVVLLNPPGAPPAARAPESVVAEAWPQAARETGRDEKTRAKKADAREVAAAGPGIAEGKARDGVTAPAAALAKAEAPANAPAEPAPALAAEAAPKQKVARVDRNEVDADAASREPAKVTSAGALAPAAAPAPAALPIVAEASRAAAPVRVPQIPRGWTVSVRGDAARVWSLRRAPDNPPPARGTAVYRVTLDGSGRVTTLHRVGGSTDPRLDAFVRGMIFEARAPLAEVETRVAARDSAASFADFEIGLAPR